MKGGAKRMGYRLLTAATLLLSASPVPGQQATLPEELFEIESEDADQSEYLEWLSTLLHQPLNLNRVSEADLAALPDVSKRVARDIVRSRKTAGPVSSVEELRERIDVPEGAALSLHTFTEARPLGLHPLGLRIRGRYMLSSEADSETDLLDGARLYERAEIDVRHNLCVGWLTERDAYETRLDDFRAVYAAYRSDALQLHLGHYVIEDGRGTMLWSPFGPSKSNSGTAPGWRRGRGITPFRSTSENVAFFGPAMRLHFRSTTVTLFLSRTHRDARLDGEGVVTSLDASGLHNTEASRRAADTVIERAGGGIVSVSPLANLTVSAKILDLSFDRPLEQEDRFGVSRGIRSKFRYSGVEAQWHRRRWIIYAEAAADQTGKASVVAGAHLRAGRTRIALHFRNLDAAYFNPHAHPFAANRNTASNEQGTYFGFDSRPWRNLVVSGYTDHYRQPEARSRNELGTSNFDGMLRLAWSPSSAVALSVRLKYRDRELSESSLDAGWLQPRVSRRVRKTTTTGQVSFRPDKRLRLKLRVDVTQLRDGSTRTAPAQTGFSAYHEVRVVPRQWVTLTTRYTLFDVLEYEARQYQWEPDLPGTVINQMIMGHGIRWFALAQLKPTRKWLVSFKYAHLDKVNIDRNGRYAVQERTGRDQWHLQFDLSM